MKIKQINYVNSLTIGFRVPEDAHGCGCGCGDYPESKQYSAVLEKSESPSLVELNLARHPHRWREVREIMRSFLTSIIKEVTVFEETLLDALGLPDIDTVRVFVIESDKKQPPQSPFIKGEVKSVNFDISEAEIKRILAVFSEALVGTEGRVTVNDMPIIAFHQQSAFAVGLTKTREAITELLGDTFTLPDAVLPDWNNLYLNRIRKESLKRVRAKIGKEYLKEIKEILQQGAEQGLNPLRIGSMLHKRIGEGQAWYWNRMARSETAIALDAAFVAEANQDGVPYEQWSTGANPCPICAALDGKIWRVGEGPRVVYDTHPHCLCVKYPYIANTNAVQEAVDHSEWPYT